MKRIISKLSVEQIRAKEKLVKELYGSNCFAKDRFVYDISCYDDDTEEDVREALISVSYEVLDLIFINKLMNKELFVEDLHGELLTLERVFDMIQNNFVSGLISKNLLCMLKRIQEYVHDLNIRAFVVEAFLKGEIEEKLAHIHRVKSQIQEEIHDEGYSEKDIAINEVLDNYLGVADKLSEALVVDPLLIEHLYVFPEKAHVLTKLYSNLSEKSVLDIFSRIVLEENLNPSVFDEKHKKIHHILALLYVLNINVVSRGYIPPEELTCRIYSLISRGLRILQGHGGDEENKEFFHGSYVFYNLMKMVINSNLHEEDKDFERCAVIHLSRLESLSDDDDFEEIANNLLAMSRYCQRKKKAKGNIFTKRIFHTQRSNDPRKQEYNLQKASAIEVPEGYWEFIDGKVDKVASRKDVGREELSGKIARKNTGLRNSFMIFSGKPYAVSEKAKKHLGSGRSVVKICQDREGNNYALKIGRRLDIESKLAMRQEGRVLSELGELIGKLSRSSVDKEYILIPLELGANLLDGYISTGIIDLLNLKYEIAIKCIEEVVRLHKIGIIHRDIKPENFMVWFEEGQVKVKIIDFGLSAKLAPGRGNGKVVSGREDFEEDDGEIRNVWGGTPGYIAPELISKPDYSAKTDAFAIGAMLDGCLDISIPELTDNEPGARPDLEVVISYLKYTSGKCTHVSFKDWLESRCDIEGEYREADNLDFAIAYRMASERYDAIMSDKEEIVANINSVCPIVLEEGDEITASMVSLAPK